MKKTNKVNSKKRVATIHMSKKYVAIIHVPINVPEGMAPEEAATDVCKDIQNEVLEGAWLEDVEVAPTE
jgi:hypothetical protein